MHRHMARTTMRNDPDTDVPTHIAPTTWTPSQKNKTQLPIANVRAPKDHKGNEHTLNCDSRTSDTHAFHAVDVLCWLFGFLALLHVAVAVAEYVAAAAAAAAASAVSCWLQFVIVDDVVDVISVLFFGRSASYYSFPRFSLHPSIHIRFGVVRMTHFLDTLPTPHATDTNGNK